MGHEAYGKLRKGFQYLTLGATSLLAEAILLLFKVPYLPSGQEVALGILALLGTLLYFYAVFRPIGDGLAVLTAVDVGFALSYVGVALALIGLAISVFVSLTFIFWAIPPFGEALLRSGLPTVFIELRVAFIGHIIALTGAVWLFASLAYKLGVRPVAFLYILSLVLFIVGTIFLPRFVDILEAAPLVVLTGGVLTYLLQLVGHVSMYLALGKKLRDLPSEYSERRPA